eukprot:57667_1
MDPFGGGSGGGMPNIPPALLDAFMSNPQLMEIMRKPGMMEKFQRAMQNPQTAMSDPDIMRIMTIMQNSGLADSMRSGGGGMGSGIPPAGARPSASGGGQVTDVRDARHFEQLLSSAGADKLVVVDFYADWCGPCKVISPVVKELASTYNKSSVFLKVNVDKNKSLATSKGIGPIPAFHFYRNGQKLDGFVGANQQKLRDLVNNFCEPPKKVKPSPYKHFPARENELISFKKVKYEPIVSNIQKFSTEFFEAKEEQFVLIESELEVLDSIVTTLRDSGSYHTSKFSNDEYLLVDKLLSWPKPKLPPVLNLVRVMILHPDAAIRYSSTDLIQRMITLIADGDEYTNNTLACLRTILNMFSRHVFMKPLLKNHEEIIAGLTSIMSSSNKNVRLSCASLLLNFSVKFQNDPESKYSDAKVLILSSMLEALATEADPAVMYRILVAAGTLLFRDTECCATAQSLDLGLTVRGGAERFASDENIGACAAEIEKALDDPAA